MIDGMYAARWHRDLMYVIEFRNRSKPKWFRENAVTHHVQASAGAVLPRDEWCAFHTLAAASAARLLYRPRW